MPVMLQQKGVLDLVGERTSFICSDRKDNSVQPSFNYTDSAGKVHLDEVYYCSAAHEFAV